MFDWGTKDFQDKKDITDIVNKTYENYKNYAWPSNIRRPDIPSELHDQARSNKYPIATEWGEVDIRDIFLWTDIWGATRVSLIFSHPEENGAFVDFWPTRDIAPASVENELMAIMRKYE